ncbi:flagellar FlbD family protein [Cytobacillus gottheilii]|uniref:flagellar FlbD family protein n=1 Tax=Cytobacillus gottheilii TaxID=859144 RepID=UPI000835EC00|nr:flagellar FlbD family protein [Cytobacillus gottheilii]
MIKVSRLNGKSFILNAMLIETIESFPDTTIMLTNGRKYVVKESEEQVYAMITSLYKTIGLAGMQHAGGNEDEE